MTDKMYYLSKLRKREIFKLCNKKVKYDIFPNENDFYILETWLRYF